MAADPVPDINATIAHAVNARIEAEIVAALAGDDFLKQYVAAAMQGKVDAPDPRGYGTVKVPYLQKILADTIREATKAAIVAWVEHNAGSIEEEVGKALQRNRKQIAEALTTTLVDTARKGYGFNVSIQLRMPNE